MIGNTTRVGSNPWGLLSGALVCLSLSLTQTPALAQGDDTAISSDGKRMAVKEAVGTVSSSFAGSGRELRSGEVDDSLANFSAAEAAAELRNFLNAKPASPKGPIAAGSVIGTDQRVRINPTTSFPARATALITFKIGSGNFICTGWFINSNTIATAGHCVADGGSGSFYNRTTYKIYPGRNGSATPYGSCTAKTLYSVVGWVTNGLDDYDYAAIKLNCNIGNTTGRYGFFWQPASLLNLPVTIQGYPGDKPSGTQWKATDKVRPPSQETRVYYAADTAGGESGAPVWYNRSSKCNPCSMAIHAYGVNSTGYNHGTRITQARYNNYVTWKNAP